MYTRNIEYHRQQSFKFLFLKKSVNQNDQKILHSINNILSKDKMRQKKHSIDLKYFLQVKLVPYVKYGTISSFIRQNHCDQHGIILYIAVQQI